MFEESLCLDKAKRATIVVILYILPQSIDFMLCKFRIIME